MNWETPFSERIGIALARRRAFSLRNPADFRQILNFLMATGRVVIHAIVNVSKNCLN
jgi:hypothetical protein